MNIYDESISVSEPFYRNYDTSWDEQLDAKRKEYEDAGYKVVFVFATNPFQDAAQAVLYDKEQHIPTPMRNHCGKYVRLNGHWVIEGQLGICDKCGEYKPLYCLCSDGMICEDCDKDDKS